MEANGSSFSEDALGEQLGRLCWLVISHAVLGGRQGYDDFSTLYFDVKLTSTGHIRRLQQKGHAEADALSLELDPLARLPSLRLLIICRLAGFSLVIPHLAGFFAGSLRGWFITSQ